MEFAVGVVLALIIGVFASIVRLDRDRAFYPVVAMVVASYYVLFAIMGGSSSALLVELLIACGFVVLAVAGFKRTLVRGRSARRARHLRLLPRKRGLQPRHARVVAGVLRRL